MEGAEVDRARRPACAQRCVVAAIAGLITVGALSLTNLDGNPLAESLEIGGILIDDPGEVARLAAREPSGEPLDVGPVATALRTRLAP